MERESVDWKVGCATLMIGAFVGGWCLQYSLNQWIPVVCKAYPTAFHNPAPITSIFPWLFVIGVFVYRIAVPMALLTFVIKVLGII